MYDCYSQYPDSTKENTVNVKNGQCEKEEKQAAENAPINPMLLCHYEVAQITRNRPWKGEIRV
jgi:hypothetical protein